MLFFPFLCCSSEENSISNIYGAESSESEFNVSIQELSNHLNISNLNLDSTSLKWKVYTMGSPNERSIGPSDYYIIATFKTVDKNLSIQPTNDTLMGPISRENVMFKEWIPDTLKKMIFTAETFKKVPIYDFDEIKKSPYLNGSVLYDNFSNYVYVFGHTN